MTHPSLRNLVSQPGDAENADAPADFRAALAALSTVRRHGFVLQQTPAPARLAPFSYAMAAYPDADGADDEAAEGLDTATARFIVLHDPKGHEAWNGTTRVVVYLSAVVDDDRAEDAGFSAESWNWLTDALTGADAAYHNLGGTVTRTISDRFGDLAEPEPFVELEVRASWTAEDTALDRHLGAWLDVFATATGRRP